MFNEIIMKKEIKKINKAKLVLLEKEVKNVYAVKFAGTRIMKSYDSAFRCVISAEGACEIDNRIE